MALLFLNKLGELIEMALRDLVRKKTRSFLTALGVIFGIASVVSMISIGEGAQNQILDQIKGMGLSNIVIKSVKPQNKSEESDSGGWVQTYGLNFSDAECIKDTVTNLEDVTILKNHSGRAWHGSTKVPVEIKGVSEKFFNLIDLKMISGRNFDQNDNQNTKSICIVSTGLLKKLSLPLAIGQSMRITSQYYTIIGIYDDADIPSTLVSDYGPTILIPLNSAYKRLGFLNVKSSQGAYEAVSHEVSQIICKIKAEHNVIQTANWVEKILTRNHPSLDFSLTVPLQLLKQKQQTQKIFNMVMVLIAAISLIVGGIGIVNIMLATVSERTKEIGIRRAIGATKQDIVYQFLMETVVLTVIAGAIGCLLGVLIIYLIENSTGWTAVVELSLFIWAFLISCIIGIGFGIYPALKAAELDPIESLRYE